MAEKSADDAKETSKTQTKANKKAEESASVPKWVIGLLAIIIIAAIVFATKGMWQSDDADSLKNDPAWATVNTERIRDSYVQRRYEELGELRAAITDKEFLNTLIGERLLIQQAKQQGFSVDTQEVTAAYETRLEANGITRDEFVVQLMESNLSEDDLLSSIHNELLVNKLLNEAVVSQVEVTDEELQELFELNKETFLVEEAVHASHILVETQEDALELKKQATPGNFAELAKEHSIDQTAAQNSGDLGFFERGMMVEPFDKAVFKLQEGEISDPVITQFGVHLILVHEHKEAGTLEFDEVEDFLRTNLLEEKTALAAREYLKQLQDIAQIEILVEFDENGQLKEE